MLLPGKLIDRVEMILKNCDFLKFLQPLGRFDGSKFDYIELCSVKCHVWGYVFDPW